MAESPQLNRRARQESVIELDMEFVRPRYTMVFSVTAVFCLIVLNVFFWENYIKVIIWAIAASQLIRPLTDDFVRAVGKIYDARLRTKRNIILVFYDEIIHKSSSSPSPASVDGRVKTTSTTRKKSSFGTFMFTNPTAFLVIAIFFHLMPFHVFLTVFLSFSVCSVVLSIIADFTGLSDQILRWLMQPEVVSTLMIAGIGLVIFIVDFTIAIATMLEIADCFSNLSRGLSSLVASLSKDPTAPGAVVAAYSPDLTWIQETALKVYEYSNKEFGQKKWWSVVESMKASFEMGHSAEVMARAGLDQMRIVYNDTEWLGLVEMAVMAAVPEHRVPYAKTVSILNVFADVSWRSIWINVGETIFRFSALAVDIFKYLSAFAAQLIIFFFILQQLCKSRRDVITCVCLITVPASTRAKQKLNDDLRSALRSAFTDPQTAGHKSALVVLLVYGILGLPGAFISTSLVYFASVFHIIPEVQCILLCSLPWLSYQIGRFYYVNQWNNLNLWFDLIRAILLPVLLLELTAYANKSRKVRLTATRKVSPWLTDFSLAVGIARFGVDGVILGPFLASVTHVVLSFVLDIAEQDLWWDDTNIKAKQKSTTTTTLNNKTLDAKDVSIEEDSIVVATKDEATNSLISKNEKDVVVVVDAEETSSDECLD